MGKRGQPLRQHQAFSKPRLLRHRHPPPQVESTDQNKSSSADTAVISSIPPRCDPPLPELNCLGNVGFEFLLCLYLHTALFCQYIYLYKFLRPNRTNAPGIMAWLLLCILSAIVWIGAMTLLIIRLMSSSSWLNMLVLCYPIVVWIPLTELSGDSCWGAVYLWMNTVDSPKVLGSDTIEAIFSRHHLSLDTGLAGLANGFIVSKTKNTVGSSEKNSEIVTIRREMEVLCSDFNSRISEIVFCSMVCSYYVGLVPMFYMKVHQHYDLWWSLLHTLLVLLNSFGLLSSHLFKPQYVHFLHKCVLWHEDLKYQMTQLIQSLFATYCRGFDYVSQQLVIIGIWYSIHDILRNKKSEQAGNQQVVETDQEKLIMDLLVDDASISRLCYIFRSLLRLTDWMLLCHASIVVIQLYLLLSSSKWDRLISLALMQFFRFKNAARF